MSIVTNPFQACNDIFFKPNGVFRAVEEKENWSWLPFFIITALIVVPNYLYFQFVDFDWYKELIIQSQYKDLSPAEQDMYRNSMTSSQMVFFSLIGGPIVVIVLNALLAAYLNAMTKSDEQNLNGFTDWYGFTWWAGMPSTIAALSMIAILALADNHQLPPSDLNPLAIGYWFNITMDSPWFSLSQSLRLDTIWSIYLVIVGITQWTSFDTRKATIIACAPYAVIWGLWSIIILS